MSGFLRATAKVVLAPAFLMLLFSSAASAETLYEVVAKSHAAPEMRPLANLNREIANYSVLDTQGVFAVAYYVQGDAPGLDGPLYVDRFDRRSRQWRSASFTRDQLTASGADCLGSVTSLSAGASGYVLTTHIHPSAACTLVLSANLGLRTALYGWPLAALADGSLVYHRSQIHFAPVHAAEIAIYNSRTGRSYTIYPAKPYQAVRQAEVARLREFFDARTDWCNRHNHPCDPELLDNRLDSPIVVDDSTDSLAFLVDYGNDADDPAAPPVAAGHRKVVYVFRHVSNEFGFRYREMLQSDVAARFGSVPLAQFLTPARLQEIFGR